MIRRRLAFSLAELLVVVGIVALLISILAPPLQHARRKAMQTRCAANLKEHGAALEEASNEHRGYYPLWDDGGTPIRYTWIDVLLQRRLLSSSRIGYCPEDRAPDPLNEARGQALGLIYPRDPQRSGVDYSYGIGVPLSAGGWAWRPGHNRAGDTHERRFVGKDSHVASRVLVADGNWSAIYNLNGSAISSAIWNDPSWFDNTVAYRHPGYSTNLLFQDGHVAGLRYKLGAAQPVDTNTVFVWYPNEPLGVGPDSEQGGNFYPDTPPPSFQSTPQGDDFPRELLPFYYTVMQSWTLIEHKNPTPVRGGDLP